jgi:hypothetical protein
VAGVKGKFCLSLFLLAALAALPHESRGQSLLRPREFRSPDSAYELTWLVWKLREVEAISSRAVGFGGAKGEFFKLSEEILRLGAEEDFRRMIGDGNVTVKVMGLVCLAQLGVERHGDLLRLHSSDGRRVRVSKGCVSYETTVGEIARRLLAEPGFLGHGEKRAAGAGAPRD